MKIRFKLLCFLSATLLSSFVFAQDLHLYVDKPGKGHVYLGCLTCDSYASNSVWNQYGDYGSRYSDTSIWNDYGDYGSKYENYSPWNKYSDTPPVLVDKSGGFYGYFTCNRYKDKRVEAGLMDYLCENREALKADLRESYYRLLR